MKKNRLCNPLGVFSLDVTLVGFIHIVCVTAHPFDHWQTLPVQLLPHFIHKVCAVTSVFL